MSASFLIVVGWGGLALMVYVFQLPPVVWARWGFFVLWFVALTGAALPAAYFLNLRFPSEPPAEPAHHCASGDVGGRVWVPGGVAAAWPRDGVLDLDWTCRRIHRSGVSHSTA